MMEERGLVIDMSEPLAQPGWRALAVRPFFVPAARPEFAYARFR